MEQKPNSDEGRNSVVHCKFAKTTIYNLPMKILSNDNVYTNFGLILSIRF